ncbi:hypothetical protein I4F81_007282 [Pyropia yezoensis]|uniref:Uncharacterized protein n=1 Tax=Pyropia yezoensis TaxID=2788 RepID=A0ACC3C4M0_PYRYE|nr:hypothetical protein I4F81_007282 [Neopyropia yezoensis]
MIAWLLSERVGIRPPVAAGRVDGSRAPAGASGSRRGVGGAVVPSLTVGAVAGVDPPRVGGGWGGSLGLGLPAAPTLGAGGAAPPAAAAALAAAGRVRPFWEAVGADGDAPSFSVCLGDDAPDGGRGGQEPIDVEYGTAAAAAGPVSPLPAGGSGGVLSFGVHPAGAFVPLSQRPWAVHRTAPHTAWVVDANAELSVGSTALLLSEVRRVGLSYTHTDTRLGGSIHAALARALAKAAAGAAAGGAAAPFNASFITAGGCAALGAAEIAALPPLELSLAGVQEHPRDGEEPPGTEVDDSPPPPRAEVRLRIDADQYAPAVTVGGRVYRCGALGVLPPAPPPSAVAAGGGADGGAAAEAAAPDAVPPDVVLGTAALRRWAVTFVAPGAGGVEHGGIAFARREPSANRGCPVPGALTPRPGAPGAAAAGATTATAATAEGGAPAGGPPRRRTPPWHGVSVGLAAAAVAAVIVAAVVGGATRWRVATAVARADAATASARPAVGASASSLGGASAWGGGDGGGRPEDEEEQALVMHVKE